MGRLKVDFSCENISFNINRKTAKKSITLHLDFAQKTIIKKGIEYYQLCRR